MLFDDDNVEWFIRTPEFRTLVSAHQREELTRFIELLDDFLGSIKGLTDHQVLAHPRWASIAREAARTRRVFDADAP